MSLARRYLFWVACVLFLFGHFSSFLLFSCSTSIPNDENLSINGGNATESRDAFASADTIEDPDGNGPQDRYCPAIHSEPHHKRSGSWAIGPTSLAPKSYHSRLVTLATDSQGNVVLLIDINHNPFLMKIGSDSVPLWTYSLPKSYRTGPPPSASIQFDSQDNIYVGGIASGTITFGPTTIHAQEKTYVVLLKFSSDGKPIWIQTMKEFLLFTTFFLSAHGELYVAGYVYLSSPLDKFGNISLPTVPDKVAQYAVVKYGSFGQLLWIQAIYTTSIHPHKYPLPPRMILDDQENIYLTGPFYDGLQFGTRNDLTINASPPSANQDDNIFVAKLDRYGSFRWATYVGTAGPHAVPNSHYYGDHSDIMLDKAGNVYLTGSWQSTRTFGSLRLPWVAPISIFVAKLTPAGVFEWAIPGPRSKEVDYLGNYYPFAHKLHLALDGSLVLTGTSSEYIHTIFSAHFDTKGKWSSIVRLGEAYGSSLTSTSTSLDKQGNLFVGGNFLYQARIETSEFEALNCLYPEAPSVFLWRLEKP